MPQVATFPGGKKVDVEYRGFTIRTDQTVKAGGEGSAPSPFDLFLASMAACAAYYVSDFCATREIPTGDIRLEQRIERNRESGALEKVIQRIVVPADFPEKYEKALCRAAGLCSVKKAITSSPEFRISVEKE